MTTRFANYDAGTGAIVGLYSSDLHPEIPQPAIALTDEQWQGMAASPSSWSVVDGVAIYVDRTPSAADILTAARAVTSCTKLQAKRVLAPIGLWEAAKTYVAADPDRQEDYDLANELNRLDAWITEFAAGAGITDAQLDAMFAIAPQTTTATPPTDAEIVAAIGAAT